MVVLGNLQVSHWGIELLMFVVLWDSNHVSLIESGALNQGQWLK